MDKLIDKKSTEEYIKKSSERVIVHRGTYDEISEILKNRCFRGNKYVSFSDGFPFLPMHGDSYIVFSKEKLLKKYDFLKIEYNKKFFENKNDLLKHVLENKSISDIKAEIIKGYNRTIERFEDCMSLFSNEEKMQYIKQIELIKKEIVGVKKNPMSYFFMMIKNEKEIVAYHPIKFEISDIEYIIYSSFEFLCYPEITSFE